MNHALLLRTTSFGVIYGPHCHQVLAVLCMKTYTFLCKGKTAIFLKILVTTVEKLFARTTRRLGFVHP